MPGEHYKKELEEYEKSVEQHVEKINRQLDEQLVVMRQKIHEKNELVRKTEEEAERLENDNVKNARNFEQKSQKIINYKKVIRENVEKSKKFEKNIREISEKMLINQKKCKTIFKNKNEYFKVDETLKQLNERRKVVVEKQQELANYRLNRTENSMRTKLEKARKKLEEIKKTKMAQDKKISRLREDIVKSEKSYDEIEQKIRVEIERQFENESKKDEIERRIKIFEVENSGIDDEFQRLLISLNEESNGEDKKISEMELLVTKGRKYLEKLDEMKQKGENGELDELASTPKTRSSSKNITKISTRLEKQNSASRKMWKTIEQVKREIIQLKRESEALSASKQRLQKEKISLENQLGEEEKNADRAAFELRNAENIRMSDLTQRNRKLKPSILVESRDEKMEKEDEIRRGLLKEKVEKLEKTNLEQKEELERIQKRSEFLKRKLSSFSAGDMVKIENEKTEKSAELRQWKRRWHENIMLLNLLHKKLKQRVLQREAALTTANSVVHLTTNIRKERKREIGELQKELIDKSDKIRN